MGMYDELYCKYPLPNPEVQDECFQTKCLRCELDQYEISSNGNLLILHVCTSDGVEPGGIIYTGDVDFYRPFDTTDPDCDKDAWYEFRATFKSGKLQSITRLIDEHD